MNGASTDSERRDNDAPPDIEDEILSELVGGASAHGGASALHAASRLHSSLASGASHASRGSRVPTVIGGGASAGSRSIIPTGNYFNAAVRHFHRVFSAQKVFCSEEKHGAQGLPPKLDSLIKPSYCNLRKLQVSRRLFSNSMLLMFLPWTEPKKC
jgi:hypothetical protein